MKFYKKLNHFLTKAWKSLGNVDVNVTENADNYEIMIHPSVREINGGVNDGGRVFARFYFDLKSFLGFFDKGSIEAIAYDCFQKDCNEHLVIHGKACGVNVRVAILNSPPPFAKVKEIEYTVGPKKGTVESLKQ